MAKEAADPQQVLTDEILADARRQADRLRRRAERDATDTADQADREAEADREQRLSEARADADRRRRLTLATVPVAEGRLRAGRIEEVLDGVREAARERLVARDGYDYREMLVRLAAGPVREMVGQAFVLELAEADRDAVGPDVAAGVRRLVGREGLQASLAAEAAAIEGGVIVRDADGRQRWDNSLAARLERLWPDLRRRIAEEMGLLEEQHNNTDERGMMNDE
ncbi:MAG: V-type ATP synthase subunit E [Planctomycetota bacterium]|nr:V-type ATP synthase subunit E [Planctomycetota bacterium]